MFMFYIRIPLKCLKNSLVAEILKEAVNAYELCKSELSF